MEMLSAKASAMKEKLSADGRELFFPNQISAEHRKKLEQMDTFLHEIYALKNIRGSHNIFGSLRKEYKATGFKPMEPGTMLNLMSLIISVSPRARPISLELGSGVGSWTILAAAFGFPSYGIEINPKLVEAARKNRQLAIKMGLLDPKVPCEFAVGNYFTQRFLKNSSALIKEKASFSGSANPGADAYRQLGINIRQAGIIYAYPWPDELELICRFLADEAKTGAIIALPGLGDNSPDGNLKVFPALLRTAPLTKGEWSFEGMIGRKI
jgi:hypothetical protein